MGTMFAVYLALKSGPDLISGLALGPGLMTCAAVWTACAWEGAIIGRWLARRSLLGKVS